MASKKETSTAVAVRTNEALAVAEGIDRNDFRGKESISQGDITLPRIAVAQKTSPQLEPDKSEYIDGLKLFELYNSVTGERYGSGPVEFVIVRMDKRAMQFDDANNVLDFDVPLDDPRLQFTNGPNGERVKPEATLFYDYIVLLADTLEPAVLSLKGTGVKVAKRLNSFIQLRPGPVWGGKYKLTSAKGQAGSFTYGVYNVAPAGAASQELVELAETTYESLKGRKVNTDRDNADETSTSNKEDAPF